LGNRLTFTVHKPLAVKDYPFDELMKNTEKAVVESINT
jgi:1-acyl-sn-glycerol-3-phosphate acyltransferase